MGDGHKPTHEDGLVQSIDNTSEVTVRELVYKDNKGLTLVVPIEVNSKAVTGVVDTAAQVTLMSTKFAEHLKTPIRKNELVILRNAQEDSAMNGYVCQGILITLGSRSYVWDVIIAPIEDNFILGLDFLTTIKCKIDLDVNMLHMGYESVPMFVKHDSPYSVCRATIITRTIIPPNSVKLVNISLSSPLPVDYILQPADNLIAFGVPYSLVRGGGIARLPIANPFDHSVVMKSSTWLGNAVELDCVCCRVSDASEVSSAQDRSGFPLGEPLLGQSSFSGVSERACSPDPIPDRSPEELLLNADMTELWPFSLGDVGPGSAGETFHGRSLPPEGDPHPTRGFGVDFNIALGAPPLSVRECVIGSLKVPRHLQQLYEKSIEGLSSHESESLLQLLIKYEDVFSRHDLDLGLFSEIEHKIDTKGATPVKHRMRRTPLGFAAEEDKTLQSMLAAGVIEPSQSEWASAPVLVRKKDGSLRYCVDFRDLNARTVRDVFPLPLIDECLDTLAGTQYFSTLDMASGYWQISIDPADRHKTAFLTRDGLFHHVRMGFGLTNAPATFQRVINQVLRGLTWKYVLAYLDDVIVLGKSFHEHLSILGMVLQRFRDHNLKLKPRKCSLLQSEVEFLGRKVGRDGISVTEHKIEAVRGWKRPTNHTEVESFLGFVNYHRDFIPGFAGISAPLYGLTGKNSSFHWGEEQQMAFDTLKEHLITAPVLAFPNVEDVFILDTDASDAAIGAELSQVQNGLDRVIAYSSYILTPAQRKYCTTKKELLAVVVFTRHFRHYLLGRRFILRTDHNSLVWLTRFKYIEGQLARWLEELSQFDMQIQHRPGKLHRNADGLSRQPDDVEFCDCYVAGTSLASLPCKGCKFCQRAHTQWKRFEDDVDDVIPLAIRTVSVVPETTELSSNYIDSYTREELRAFQLQDSHIAPVIDWMEKGDPDADVLSLQSRSTKILWKCKVMLRMIRGVLFYQWDYISHKKNKLVVPDALKAEILQAVHDSRIGGHLGITNTILKLKQSFYWTELAHDATVYVKTCSICNKNKKTQRKGKAAMKNYQAGSPLERVHLDVLGPFVESTQGNKYVLMIIDQFTRWIECCPIAEQTAETTAKTFFDQFVSRFGVPLQVHTDQGRNFDGNLFNAFCDMLQVSKTRTTPYRPQSNGQVEVYNRTLLQFIRCFLKDKQKEWDKFMPALVMSIRATVNRNTGFTPNMLMLGREIHVPVDIMFGIPEANQGGSSVSEYLADLSSVLKKSFAMARENLRSSQLRQKRLYDIHLKQSTFSVGDLVYLFDSSSKVGTSRKLKPLWTGPYVVIHVISPILYKIENRKRTLVIHHDRLKLCQDRVIPFWIRRKRHQVLSLDETLPYEQDEDPEDPRCSIIATSSISPLDHSVCEDTPESTSVNSSDSIFLDSIPDNDTVTNADTSSSASFDRLPCTTRSGRIPKAPAYLKEYV